MSIKINTINSINDFRAIKDDWDFIHGLDKQATVFTSWAWLHGWYAVEAFEWKVLIAKNTSNNKTVGFLPLSFRNKHIEETGENKRVLQMGGNPQADYTGFVVCPDHENEVLAAFSHEVQSLDWDCIEMHDIHDDRLVSFIDLLAENKLQVDSYDGFCCPYVPLPGTWEDFSQNILSSRTRQSLKRKMRKISELPGYRVTSISPENKDEQINALLKLWDARWGDGDEFMLSQFRSILNTCFEESMLWLDIMWDRDTPVVALAAFLDHQCSTFRFYITGFDECYGRFSPGKLIVMHAIQAAISLNFKVFDFMRGEEAYKFSFGGQKRFNTSLIVTRFN